MTVNSGKYEDFKSWMKLVFSLYDMLSCSLVRVSKARNCKYVALNVRLQFKLPES
jgi:hypothetical protein